MFRISYPFRTEVRFRNSICFIVDEDTKADDIIWATSNQNIFYLRDLLPSILVKTFRERRFCENKQQSVTLY